MLKIIKKINLIILIIFCYGFFWKLSSSELLIDIFGKEKVKTYKIDDNNFFQIINSQSVFKTNTNINGNSESAGTPKIYNKL